MIRVDFWHVQCESCSVWCEVKTLFGHTTLKSKKDPAEGSGLRWSASVWRRSREQITTSDWCRLILGDGRDEWLENVKEGEAEKNDACEWR